jgi:Mlc titration factor MtfA (ptsG expression regulator)
MIIAAIILVLLGSAFLFYNKSKVKPAVNNTLKATYKRLLSERVAYYQKLTDQDKTRFVEMIASFLQSVHIEGVGTVIDDTDLVLIASSAVIPVFGFPGWQYKNLTNVILYPDTFNNDFQFEGESRHILGMVGSGYMNGQMLLSRAALINGFSNTHAKENTAIHEFVHLLDSSDGATDGIPEYLMDHVYALPWLHMIHQEMHRIEAGKSDINPYALTNEAEFLAVVSEYFFEKPEQLQQKHPELYKQLSQMFMQDPAEYEL